MQYDSYRAKVNKVAGILGRMYAHRLIIAIALVAVTLILTALVMTKGLLVAESDCPAEVTYGDKLGYRVHFMTAKTHYVTAEITPAISFRCPRLCSVSDSTTERLLSCASSCTVRTDKPLNVIQAIQLLAKLSE